MSNEIADQLYASFAKLDRDGVGVIDYYVFFRFCEPLGIQPIAREALSCIGVKEGEPVNYQEFLNWLGFEAKDDKASTAQSTAAAADLKAAAPIALINASTNDIAPLSAAAAVISTIVSTDDTASFSPSNAEAQPGAIRTVTAPTTCSNHLVSTAPPTLSTELASMSESTAASISQVAAPNFAKGEETVNVRIVAGRDLTVASGETTKVLVSVETPDGEERQSTDLACVIDVSGSMGMEATIQGAAGTTERHGLSLLDVAKHGVRTIIQALSDRDRLALVAFQTTARTIFPLTRMDEAGKTFAQEKLDELRAGGATDIWKGLEQGLENLRARAEGGRFAHVMLLTDGESSASIRDNIMPNLKQYKNVYNRLPGSINTFGFGYRLDSKLLVDLAIEGSGSYSFIPDAGFVGTAFVNSMSNLLVTMGQRAYLILEAGPGAEIVGNTSSISGGTPVVKQEWTLQYGQVRTHFRVDLGNLQYGQNRNIVVPMLIKDISGPFLAANVQYENGALDLVEGSTVEVNAVDAKCDPFSVQLVERHHCRSKFAEVLGQMVCEREMRNASEQEVVQARAMLIDAIEEVKASPVNELAEVKALLEDMCGQATEAVSRLDWFLKWGHHYLPSVMFAHRLEQCINFKDPGIQFYGGKLFQITRDDADDVFNTLPAPQPSIMLNRSTTAPAAMSVDMSVYNDRFAG